MTREPFGTTAFGTEVERITLANADLQASILTYGATLQDVRLTGLDRPLTLGSDRLAEYEPGGALQFFGPIAGPVANRIRNARAELDGRELAFDANGAGGHCLHGGSAALHIKVWDVAEVTETRLHLTTHSPDGEGGFPGNRRWDAHFTLDGSTLTLTFRVETDAPSLVNLANHSYWNLGPAATFDGHILQIDADHYLPADENDLATGEMIAVDGTRYDFRTPRALGPSDVLDNNFCLAEARRAIRPVGRLTGPDGVAMGIETTEPGLQIYDAKGMSSPGASGHDHRRYGPRCGLAVEAQFWPDAPNNPAFPSIRVAPGDAWEQVTRFTFSRS
ncbi:aldose 1-epimerase [Aliiruegeria haliotis]|uniref:Aldose 1-epimerase n=1 Tax=Aliiruegeria haliotis TaxID=1280846 RepID=A0A2T0RN89_9RHOB|nr:aldose epimerase family protein [Aliiruegeria haliotis]PRY22597.1 aldose 1-epimerase [Aliiruegeria haliotis]